MKRRIAPQVQVLKPHQEQEGWVYVRVKKVVSPFGDPWEWLPRVVSPGDYVAEYNEYHDKAENARIISSRRVEEAVETADFLKKCAEEGLLVVAYPDGKWDVAARYPDRTWRSNLPHCLTLREAYFRYHQAVDK